MKYLKRKIQNRRNNMNLEELANHLHSKKYISKMSGEDLKNILIELNAFVRNIPTEERWTFSAT